MLYKNLWGTANQGFDQQRADLFEVEIILPAACGGVSAWNNHVKFAVQKFPFPDRKSDTIPVKYMNQTNHVLGADAPTGPIEIPVRYAFNQETHRRLEMWKCLCSNPRSGGVALTSFAKAMGEFRWLIPDMRAQQNFDEKMAFIKGQEYTLEGILITGLKPGGADMAATGDASLVNLEFTLQVDRYYPKDLDNMVFSSNVGNRP